MIKKGDRFNIKHDTCKSGPYLCDDVTENYYGSGMTMVRYKNQGVSSLRILRDCEKIEESKCEI